MFCVYVWQYVRLCLITFLWMGDKRIVPMIDDDYLYLILSSITSQTGSLKVVVFISPNKKFDCS